MYLDREQELALKGEYGPAREWAMDVLVRLGEQAKSSRLISVSSIHIPDWSRERSSEAWEWLESVAGKVMVPVTANPGGMDDPFMLRQKRILESLSLQGTFSFSCAPYLSGNHPGKGKAAAWGGRAASAFANSILGARSEMETFESAIASAITGLTPERGLHLEENRQATIAMVIPDKKGIDYSVLGWVLSRHLEGEVPLLCGVRPSFDEAKKLALSLNANGQTPLFRLQRDRIPPPYLEVIELDDRTLMEDIDVTDQDPDLCIIGCPHLSEQEINRWSIRLAGRGRSGIEVWFFTSRLCMDKSPKSGAVLSSIGKVFTDRCPVAMCQELSGRKVACDSPVMAACLQEKGIPAFFLPENHILSRLLS